MAPEQLRDKLTDLMTSTTQLINIPGWEPHTPLFVEECEDGQFRFGYMYRAPNQPASRDREADVKAVSDYWQTLGFTTRAKGQPDALVVFASSEDFATASFGTGPAYYTLGATTRCITGNIKDYL